MKASERYKFLKELGAGGMGEVFLAEDVVLKRQVAIKRIHGQLAHDKQFLDRLERESVLHARVGAHPNIVSLFDRTEDNGQIYIVLEYVPGTSLRRALEDHQQPLQTIDAVNVVIQVLNAMEIVHSHGIVHRDIKPENVMVIRDRGELKAKLLDFGIARGGGETNLTNPSSGSPGTPRYMAPEQIAPEQYGPPTHALDLYAIGTLLYESLSGVTPFEGTFYEVLAGHLHKSPRPLMLRGGSIPPTALADVVYKALAKQPHDRYRSAAEFREALRKVLPQLEKLPTDPQPASAKTTVTSFPKTVADTPLVESINAGQQQPVVPPKFETAPVPAKPIVSVRMVVGFIIVALLVLGGILGFVLIDKWDDLRTAVSSKNAARAPQGAATSAASPTPANVAVNGSPTAESSPAQGVPTQVPATATSMPTPVSTSPTPSPTSETRAPRSPAQASPSPTQASPSPMPTPEATPTSSPADLAKAKDGLKVLKEELGYALKALEDMNRDSSRSEHILLAREKIKEAEDRIDEKDAAGAAEAVREGREALRKAIK